MRKLLLTSVTILSADACFAHGFSGSGFLHPLTGIDHLMAMIAVGAWSAQLGGKAIFRVPASFLIMMCLGGLIGIKNFHIGYIEFGIALSVALLGAAVAINKKTAWLFAAMAVGLFGFCHGYSHGAEIPQQQHITEYIIGFLVTTLGLHVAGAVGGLLLLEERNGKTLLRGLGTVAAAIGIFLLLKLLK